MRNKISPSHSLSKRNFKQIKIYPDPKKNEIPIQKNKSELNNILEICNSIYEDCFPNILKISKINFFKRFHKEADEIFLSGKFKNSGKIKLILESKENIIKKYDKDFKFLNEEFNNFLKNRKSFKYISHFRKHCIDTEHFAMHYCSSNKKGKFIEIKNKLDNKDITYVVCEECRECYLSKFILMLCNHCNRKYFSNILKENEDENILPATWKKYHCNSLINAIMKCIKCKNTLYFDLATKTLVCLNKKCNFSSKPESIVWTCNTCSQEFRSPAKIYNPLEFQILKKSINYALLKQIKASPRELPCHCTKHLSKLIFFHKEECKGELYKGMLIDRPMIVCSKCKAINFEEKFTWTCPICNIKFHLHRVIGCKPFSKKKYIINKSFNRSLKNLNIKGKKLDKDSLVNNLLSSSVSLLYKKDFTPNKTLNNSNKSSHSKLPPSEDMNNISTFNTNNNDNLTINEKFFKKIELNKMKKSKNNENEYENENESNKIYDYKKKCWIINLKKNQNKIKETSKPKKNHSTLLEILQKRMNNSESIKDKQNENDKFNKTMIPKKRIINHNMIRRKKDMLLNDKNDIYNKNEDTLRKNIEKTTISNFNDSLNKKRKIDNYYKNKKFENSNIHKNEKEKRSCIKINFKKKISSFKSEISLKNHKIEPLKIWNNSSNNIQDKSDRRDKSDKSDISDIKIKESNNIITSRTINDDSNKETEDNNVYSSLQHSERNNYKSTLNSFRLWKRKYTAASDETKKNENLRSSKLDGLNSNKLDTEPSYNENLNNNYNISTNSSFHFSFLGNNSINKTNNIHNIDKTEINEINEIKETSIIYTDRTKKNNKEKEEEESNYSDEENDKIDDLKRLVRKSKMEREKNKKEENEEKEDKFNDSLLYEKKEGVSSEEDEENQDTIKDVIFNSNAKKNFRESLILKSSFIRQSILISQDKLNNLATKTDIPAINESDYNYLKPIGEGTYGVVFLVEHNKTSEHFALKKIICRDYNELIKQKNELELIFSIKHENILKLYGIQFKYLDETTSAIFVLMELAQNDWNTEIKRRILAKRYYKEYELINLLKQIIKGFLFLQDKNIAHRDIKPQNILLFPNNIYKIADFGEAKFIKNIAEQSTLRGSELYMAPLLYKGYKYNQKNVLHNPYKSDVFSLGYCLLYAMCLNLKVLEVVRELSTMKSIINNINKFMTKNKYSEKLLNIIYKMIEPVEDSRFDFEDLFFELEKL